MQWGWHTLLRVPGKLRENGALDRPRPAATTVPPFPADSPSNKFLKSPYHVFLGPPGRRCPYLGACSQFNKPLLHHPRITETVQKALILTRHPSPRNPQEQPRPKDGQVSSLGSQMGSSRVVCRNKNRNKSWLHGPALGVRTATSRGQPGGFERVGL